MDLGAGLSGFKSWFCHFLVVTSGKLLVVSGPQFSHL